MASSSTFTCNFFHSNYPSSILPPTPPTTSFSSHHPLLCAFNPNGIRVSLRPSNSTSRVCAKFEKFQGEPSQEADTSSPPSLELENTETFVEFDDEEEDDSCLPLDLEGAVRQSSEAAALFVSSGGMRAIVELLIPQLQFLDDEGAQVELWELSRIFLDTLIKETKCQRSNTELEIFDENASSLQKSFDIRINRRDGCAIITDFTTHDTSIHRGNAYVMNNQISFDFPALLSSMTIVLHDEFNKRVKAIFPDAGAAALLKYRWKDALFSFASLSDRKPVDGDDEMVVMIVPDYQMLEYVERIASALSNDPPRPLIMWNPRLISEDVGVGFNVRRLRRYFLSTFSTVYHMRPMPFGAIFRCYPGLWKVFSDDKDRPNRYLLAKEYINRPDAEDLEILFGNEEQKSEQGQSLLDKAAGIFSSINRFMKAM